MEKLGTFSDTATDLVNDAGDDLVTNLQNLEPALKALADIGPWFNAALIFATAFPYGPTFADKITRGDYINLYAIFDLTYPRLKKTLLLGTRWGDENAKAHPGSRRSVLPQLLVQPDVGRCRAASGRRSQLAFQTQPGEPMPPVTEPLLPVTPPPVIPGAPAPVMTLSQIFAGPYGAEAPPPPAPAEPPASVPPAPGGGG